MYGRGVTQKTFMWFAKFTYVRSCDRELKEGRNYSRIKVKKLILMPRMFCVYQYMYINMCISCVVDNTEVLVPVIVYVLQNTK